MEGIHELVGIIKHTYTTKPTLSYTNIMPTKTNLRKRRSTHRRSIVDDQTNNYTVKEITKWMGKHKRALAYSVLTLGVVAHRKGLK